MQPNGDRMKRKVAQIQFTRQQVEQLVDLKRQTGLTRTKLVRRAVDFYILQIKDHGYKSTMISIPTVGTREASQEQKVGPSVASPGP